MTIIRIGMASMVEGDREFAEALGRLRELMPLASRVFAREMDMGQIEFIALWGEHGFTSSRVLRDVLFGNPEARCRDIAAQMNELAREAGWLINE